MPFDITHICYLIYSTNETFHRKEIMDLENRLVLAWGEGQREGVGGIWSLGLTDENYCSGNGLTMRSCCVALRTMSRYLQRSTTTGEKIMYTCMCKWGNICTVGKKSMFGEITIKNKFKKREHFLLI